MAVYSRNVLLFLALAGAALATWILAREPIAGSASTVGRSPPSRSYYLTGAVVHGTDDEGRIYYRIFADRIEQQEKGDDLWLYDLSIRYSPEADVSWEISAARGRAPADRNFIELLDSVRVADAGAADGPETLLETSELQLYLDEFRATSSAQIHMRKGRSAVSARGLELDLETDDWRLVADVSIRNPG